MGANTLKIILIESMIWKKRLSLRKADKNVISLKR